MSTTQAAVPATQVISTPTIVQAGTFIYGYNNNPGEWHLDQGSGERLFDAEIKFAQPFSSPPTVVIALTGLDSSGSANTRVVLSSGDVTPMDFEIVVKTWADSLVYTVWGTWTAFGS